MWSHIDCKYTTRKMVPIYRANKLIPCIFCMHVNRKEEDETEQQQKTYKFTLGYNILHRLQVYHLTLTFIIRNNYHISLIRTRAFY